MPSSSEDSSGRSAAAADDGRAIAAGQRIADFHRTDRASRKPLRPSPRLVRFRGNLHEHANCNTIFLERFAIQLSYSGGFRKISSPSVGGSEKGIQTLSFIQTPENESS